MAISDEKRREVAARMRKYDVAEFKESAIVPFLEILGHGYTGWRGVLDELADLIDRPTCELVEVWDDEAKQHYLDCTACHFGRLSIELDDVGMRFNSRALWASVDYASLTHCPYCGADVER